MYTYTPGSFDVGGLPLFFEKYWQTSGAKMQIGKTFT